MVMDSVLMGSLTFYRKLLNENVFSRRTLDGRGNSKAQKLPAIGHAIAGVMAGCTVSFVAAPVEHVKARLQVQYQADKSKRLYSGPINCAGKLVRLNHWAPFIFLLNFDSAPPAWHRRPLSWTWRHALLQIILLFLVGYLRYFHSCIH